MEWRGKPVYIVRRTQESLDALNQIKPNELKDANSNSANQPAYVGGNARSLQGKEEVLVLVACVRILAVRLCTGQMLVLPILAVMLGWVDSSVPVMVRHSICLDVFLLTYQRQQIWRFRRIVTSRMMCWLLALTRRWRNE